MAAKFLLPFCLSVLILSAGVAAGEPDWVKQAVEAAKDYVVDPETSALILHESASVEIKSEGRSKLVARKAVKVLNHQGVEATYLVERIGEKRNVKELKGWLVDKDGKCRGLKKENIAEVDVEDAAGYYNDVRQLVAIFPDVGAGDIVAYEYVVEEKSEWEACYQSYIFQASLPVKHVSFDVTIPSDWQYTVSSRNLDGVKHSAEGSTLRWSFTDLPYRPAEPLMPPWKYVSRRILFNCYDPHDSGGGHFPDWRSAVKWGTELQSESFFSDTSMVKEVMKISEHVSSPWDRFCAIAEYVRDQVRYVAVEIGEGRFTPRSCSSIWSNKFGDCKDKVALMRAILRTVDIAGYPVLARSNAPVDPDLPTPLQFNHVILSVPLDALGGVGGDLPALHDGWLFFDPTHEAIPPGWLPEGLHGSRILRLSPEDSALITLPRLDSQASKRLYRAEAVLHDDLSISGKVRVIDYGTRAFVVSHERSTRAVEDIVSEWRDLLAKSMQTPEISNVSISNDGDSAWIEFSFSAANYLSFSGDFGLLKVDFCHPDEPFELKAKERIHPVWFGYGARETDFRWTLPADWSLDELPVAIMDSTESADMRFTAALEENGLHVTTDVRYTGRVEEINEYDRVRSFYRNVRTAYETRVILTRK